MPRLGNLSAITYALKNAVQFISGVLNHYLKTIMLFRSWHVTSLRNFMRSAVSLFARLTNPCCQAVSCAVLLFNK